MTPQELYARAIKAGIPIPRVAVNPEGRFCLHDGSRPDGGMWLAWLEDDTVIDLLCAEIERKLVERGYVNLLYEKLSTGEWDFEAYGDEDSGLQAHMIVAPTKPEALLLCAEAVFNNKEKAND